MWFFLCFFCFYNGFLYFYSQELSDWIIRIFLIVKESLWKWFLLFYLSSYHSVYYLSFSYLDLFLFGLSFSPHFLAFTFPDFFILSDFPPLSLNFPLSLPPFPRPPPNFPHSFPNLFSFNFRYLQLLITIYVYTCRLILIHHFPRIDTLTRPHAPLIPFETFFCITGIRRKE